MARSAAAAAELQNDAVMVKQDHDDAPKVRDAPKDRVLDDASSSSDTEIQARFAHLLHYHR